MSHFVKLYASILDSTIWAEPAPTVKVWLTLLAMADPNGFVDGAMLGVMRRAIVSREECETAIRVLESPDPDSKTPDHEGRRIERKEGGWQILNHRKYRDLRTENQIAVAQRVKEHRDRKKALAVTDVTRSNARNGKKRDVRDVRAEVEVDVETTRSTTTPENAVTCNGGTAPPEKPAVVSKPKRGDRLVPTEDEAQILRYYAEKHPRRGPYDNEQLRKIRKGLLSFSVAQMKLAIDGNFLDEWSVEKRKHGIGWIFKNNDQISENIDRATAGDMVLVGEDSELTEAGKRYFTRSR